MDFNGFVKFLEDFQLLLNPQKRVLSLEMAHLIFCFVSNLENVGVFDAMDTEVFASKSMAVRLEFEEFTSAIVAIALVENVNPFLMWHQKIHLLLQRLFQKTQKQR